MLVETNYYTKMDDGRIRCDVCPRACTMRNGQLGLCTVRGAANDQIYLLSHGEASGFCIDPVEKKPLNHFLPGTPILSFGQTGCNLTCKFCQNYSISKSRSEHLVELLSSVNRPEGHNQYELEQGVANGRAAAASKPKKKKQVDRLNDRASPELIAEAAVQTGCRSVAFTYNDPVIFMEFAMDVSRACHERDIKTVAVTAGYMCPEPRAEFYNHIDAANVDLKAFTEEFYQEICSSHLDNVLDTLKYLKHETDVWFEITTLLIPDENDSDRELNEECAWIVENLGLDVPLHFSAFHPDWKMMDKPNTPGDTLKRAQRIALKHGINHVYLGNIHDHAGSSTYCKNCGETLIGRDWYELSDWRLDDGGKCTTCGTQCDGRFDGPPGTWGRKRQPVSLNV